MLQTQSFFVSVAPIGSHAFARLACESIQRPQAARVRLQSSPAAREATVRTSRLCGELWRHWFNDIVTEPRLEARRRMLGSRSDYVGQVR